MPQPPTAHDPSQATGYHVPPTLEHPAGQDMWQGAGNDPIDPIPMFGPWQPAGYDPMPMPGPGLEVVQVAAGTDNSFANTTDGVAYSWGFSANYQTGQGTDDDVPIATALTNSAVRGQTLNWAGAGGQFSILTAPWGGVADQVMED
ncbi:MAG: hypothetical protein M1826_000833 [Phylliscum demangeonii]|nr:MAG: hypothetical protein M1826_000833 [Phylliscum demangeonii]